MGGVGDALADLAGDLLHRPLTLGQQVGDLGPVAASQGPGDLERTTSLVGTRVFHLSGYLAVFSFIIAFGVIRAWPGR